MIRRLLLALLLCCWFVPAWAAITFNAAADLGNNGGTTTSLTTAYTSGSGANRLLLVFFSGDNVTGGVDDISSVTYAGTTMTLAAKFGANVNLRWMYVYYLFAPATGSNNVVITAASSHYLLAGAADYTGVKQSAQPDASATGDSGGAVSSKTTSLTTVADNSWVVLLEQSDSTSPATAGTGSTQRTTCAAFPQSWSFFDSNGPKTPAGSYSMTTGFTSGTGIIDHLLVSFSPAVAGTVTCPQSIALMGVGC